MGKVLDTMIWINALWKNSPYREEAKKMIKEYEEEIVIPFNIVLEIFNVLTRKVGMDAEKVYRFLRLITLKYKTYVPREEDYILAIKIAKDRKISVFDALVLAICVNNDFNLITFDRRLRK